MARAFRHCSNDEEKRKKRKKYEKVAEELQKESPTFSLTFYHPHSIWIMFSLTRKKIMSPEKLSYVLQKAESRVKSDFRATAVMNAKSENELPSYQTQSQST